MAAAEDVASSAVEAEVAESSGAEALGVAVAVAPLDVDATWAVAPLAAEVAEDATGRTALETIPQTVRAMTAAATQIRRLPSAVCCAPTR